MSKTVTIPSNSSMWTCYVNGKKYSYPGGSTQTVPDEVAFLISGVEGAYPPAPESPADPWMPDDVVHTGDLAPYAKSADVMVKAASITGYDATKTQTLKNDKGTLKWVSDATE